MIYQKDWLMRQIEMVIAAIGHFFFHTEPKTVVLPVEENAQSDVDREVMLRRELDGWLTEGDLCTAEDWLFENIDPKDVLWLKLALYFYDKLNQCTDEYLNAHNFPREEIDSGLAEVCGRYGCKELFWNDTRG